MEWLSPWQLHGARERGCEGARTALPCQGSVNESRGAYRLELKVPETKSIEIREGGRRERRRGKEVDVRKNSENKEIIHVASNNGVNRVMSEGKSMARKR